MWWLVVDDQEIGRKLFVLVQFLEQEQALTVVFVVVDVWDITMNVDEVLVVLFHPKESVEIYSSAAESSWWGAGAAAVSGVVELRYACS